MSGMNGKRFGLHRRRHRSADRRWLEDRQAILEFNRSLTLIADPGSLMASIATRLKELFNADRLVILYALAGEGFTIAFSAGYEIEKLRNVRLAQEDRLARWLLTNEKPLVIDRDAGVFAYLSAAERETLTRVGARVCLPLIALNRLTGLALVSSTRPNWKLSDEDLALMQMFADQASIAFENAYLYQQQRDRLRRLYSAERLAAVGQLAASVAHEIRNPLQTIRSTVQYLLSEFDEHHPKRPLVEGVIAEVDRVDRAVDGLLGVARRGEFKPERIAIGPLIERSLLLAQTKARRQRVEIGWSGAAPDIFVKGDASQLNQLFLNLIMNALQAMPEGGRLDLRANRQSPPGGLHKEWVEVSIVDTGCGIAPENLEKIFDPFFTTKKMGTGLGLFISREIARQHGGEIEVQSQEGKGSSVAVRLPLIP